MCPDAFFFGLWLHVGKTQIQRPETWKFGAFQVCIICLEPYISACAACIQKAITFGIEGERKHHKKNAV